MSTACLPLDTAIPTAQKFGIDTSLLGAFDETLRQATRPDPQPAAGTQSARSSTKPQTAAEADRQDDGPTDEVRSDEGPDEGDATPAAENETIPSEGSESAESGCEDSNDQVAAGEQAETGDTEEVEEVEELPAAEAAAIVSGIVPAVVDETVQEPPEGETLEPAPIDAEGTSPGAKTAGTQTSAAGAMNVPSEQAAAEPEIDTAAKTTESTGETAVAQVEDQTSEEGDSEAEKKSAAGRRIEGESEELVAEGTEKSEASNETGVGGEDPSAEKSEKHKSGKREKKYLGEAVSNSGGQAAQGDIQPALENAARPPIEQPRVESTENSSAPVADMASATDPGTTTSSAHASGPVDGATAGTATANSALSQAAAGRSSGKEAAQGADSAKFVQRVANAFSALGQRSDATVRLKLHPAELGSLRIEITVKNGALSARVEAETTTAQSLLVENLPLLRERLADQGIKVERFDVGVADQSQGGPSERSDGGDRSFRQDDRGADSRNDSIAVETDFVDGRNMARLSLDGRLDVFI